MDERHVDTIEAAKIIGADPRTLEAWRYRKKGPPYFAYSLRQVRYRVSDLMAWIEQHRVDPDARAESSDRVAG
jgi:hypothetical protein